MGKGIYGFFTDKQGQAASGSDKNLPAVLRPESIFLINLVCPKPYTIIAPETKTTDTTERRIKKKSDNREADKIIETQLTHLLNPHKLKKITAMKRRLNILSILVFIVLGLSLYTTGYQFGTGMKAGMSLAKEQHKESKACDRPMLAGDFRFVDVVPTIAMIKPDTIINAQNNEKVPVMYTQMAVRTGKEVNYSYLIISSSCSLMNALLTLSLIHI